MKIYFDASPSGIEEYGENFELIARIISDLGHENTSDFIEKFSKDFYKLSKNKWSNHYEKIKKAVYSSDVVVVEVTKSSMSIGMCVQQAIMMGKPIITLHTKDREDIFIGGAEDVESKLLVIEYELDSLKNQLEEALDYVVEWLDCRFTLIINNKIKKHLDEVVQTGVTRSEYIRDLITEKMEK